MKLLSKTILPLGIALGTLASLLAQDTATTSVQQKDEQLRSSAQPGRSKRNTFGGGGGIAARRNERLASVVFRGSGRNALIVRNEETDPKVTEQLQEDLAIMSRILEKATAEFKDERQEAAGIALTVHGGAPVRATYLEGYGVLFTLDVNLPLKPEPKAEETAQKQPSGANQEWQEAKNEVLGVGRRRQSGDTFSPSGVGGGYAVFGGGYGVKERFSRREFNPAELKELQDSITEALRNASNIRNLKDTDWITVVLRGPGGPVMAAFGGGGNSRYWSEKAGTGEFIQIEPGSPFEESAQIGESSTMVFRVKKSDADQLSKKEQLDQFREKVSVVTY